MFARVASLVIAIDAVAYGWRPYMEIIFFNVLYIQLLCVCHPPLKSYYCMKLVLHNNLTLLQLVFFGTATAWRARVDELSVRCINYCQESAELWL